VTILADARATFSAELSDLLGTSFEEDDFEGGGIDDLHFMDDCRPPNSRIKTILECMASSLSYNAQDEDIWAVAGDFTGFWHRCYALRCGSFLYVLNRFCNFRPFLLFPPFLLLILQVKCFLYLASVYVTSSAFSDSFHVSATVYVLPTPAYSPSGSAWHTYPALPCDMGCLCLVFARLNMFASRDAPVALLFPIRFSSSASS
jgi:hypothetical protein